MNVEMRTKIKELLPHVRGLDSELAFRFMRERVDSFPRGTEVSDDELRQTISEPKQAAEPFKMLFLQGTPAYRLSSAHGQTGDDECSRRAGCNSSQERGSQ